ncbi:MAG: ABC transporter permease, partial [Bryobacteraceae bacterium]
MQINGATKHLTIGFIVRSKGDLTDSDPHFAAMDIGWAQELLGRSGTLNSISLRLTKSANPQQVVANLRKIVPPDVSVAAPAQRGAEVEKMLAGFQLNLAAMSLVSLLVGMFLIYNTIEASVVRRRSEIGILRSLGATRGEVRALFLSEAAVLGLIGVAVGLVGGYFLARTLVGTVAETISSLYVLVSVQQIVIAPWVWLSALLLGLISVLVAAWLPAQAAAATDPIEALHGGTRIERSVHLSPRWIFGGGMSRLLATVFSFLALRVGPPWLGFGAAFFVLAGFSLAAPQVIALFTQSMGARVRPPLEPRLAAQNLGRALLRNSITIASLAAAVAMTVGVAVMVFSFRQTVGTWIDQTLIADLFIGPAANEIAGPTSFMPPDAIHFLEKEPAVAAVDTFRAFALPFRDQTISIAVIRGSNRRNLRFLHGNNNQIMPRFYSERCVLVSESFARRYHVKQGGTLSLPTPTGIVAFPIIGVFYDYTNDQGIVFLSEKNFQNTWQDDRIN